MRNPDGGKSETKNSLIGLTVIVSEPGRITLIGLNPSQKGSQEWACKIKERRPLYFVKSLK